MIAGPGPAGASEESLRFHRLTGFSQQGSVRCADHEASGRRAMFFTYVGKELRRRRRQALMVALGLALGIGLVVTVSAMAAGVRTAQGQVLQSLYGVGTDVTVTQTPGPDSGGPARFGLNAPNQNRAGGRFARDQILQSPGLGTISAAQVSKLSALHGVRAASGGLSLTSIHVQGRFAKEVAGSGGQLGPGSAPVAAPS